MASRGQCAVALVEGLARGYPDAKHAHPASPAWVPLCGESGAVEIEVDATGRHAPMVGVPGRIPVGDREPDQAIEGDRDLHICHDEVELVDHRFHGHPLFSSVATAAPRL